MGRLRNLSLSLKAAAFQNASGSSSPVNNKFPTRDDSPQSPSNRSPIAREDSSPTADSSDFSRRARSNSNRPSQIYEPPMMASSQESVEELKPVFSFLSSHQNKLYQEGYFLKLNDLDTAGKPNADRSWTECFAQLVGTVLSLWDAAALDAAGQDGEVAPTFINLADASIKMIETLPTRNKDVEPLQNVLSVSTAGKNRYLLHFNSLHSLTQWTAGIRLAMFESTSLHELYTGSLIAGKGKTLNNIRTIMQPSKFIEEDWCRVRFGAGTPWRRCRYVIEPPDEKEWQKANKSLKKRGTYERVSLPQGMLKFYDNKKTKKATPIATISEVYAAYAVYPQSKPLIEQSTLVKLEGKITIHSKPESSTEGFVFVMPEVHPAVSGFEMMLRFLFPVFDTFTLYGRPNRLIADSRDTRGLMFAMPKDRRYGYLDIMDVAGLIHTNGSDKWSERQWRRETRDLVARRMAMAAEGRTSESSGRRSLGSRPAVRFTGSGRLSDELPNQSTDAVFESPKKTYTAPAAAQSTSAIKSHVRSVSESLGMVSPTKRRQQQQYVPSKLTAAKQLPEEDAILPPPAPPAHRQAQPSQSGQVPETRVMRSTNSSDSDLQPRVDPEDVIDDLAVLNPPTPVGQPTFNHQASDQPMRRPRDRPDLRREKSRMSNATLSQLVDASKNSVGSGEAGAAAAAAWNVPKGNLEDQSRGVNTFHHPDDLRREANTPHEDLKTDIVRPVVDRGTSHRKLVPRSTSQHSITRKPLPADAKVVLLPPTDSSIPRPDPAMTDPRDGSADYAELTESVPSPNMRRPGGVRKTIGDPTFGHQHRKSDIPDVDFGITHSLRPDSRGSNSRPSTAGRTSPLPPHSRNSSGPTTPRDEPFQYGHSSPLGDRPRPLSQYAWTPVPLGAGGESPTALTPEEFVAQRAAANKIHGHMPRRTNSSGKLEIPVTPPPAPSASKKLQKKPRSRPTSRDVSYGPGGFMSAREQEYGTRSVGGSPLRSNERSSTLEPSTRLAGTGEYSEQGGRSTKEGLSNHLMYAEAVRRQQAQHQQMQQAQAHAHTHAHTHAHNQQKYPVQQRGDYYAPQQFPQQHTSFHSMANSPYSQTHQPQYPLHTQVPQSYHAASEQTRRQYNHDDQPPSPSPFSNIGQAQ